MPIVARRREERYGRSLRSHHADTGNLSRRATVLGLRISVAHVVNLVANGMTPAQILEELPELQEEDVRQALGYAAAMAQDE